MTGVVDQRALYTVRDIVPPTWKLGQKPGAGKVRETYEVEGDPGHLYMVCTDRISAFDVVSTEPIPWKGVVLNLMSAFWFGYTRSIVPNHFVRVLGPNEAPHPDLAWRTSVVRRADVALGVEAIFRNLLTGSALSEYKKSGTVCGMRVKAGMIEGDPFTKPVYTPSTKAPSGEHDINIHPNQVPIQLKAKNGISLRKGTRLNASMRRIGLDVMARCTKYAAKQGIALADTKMEFGLAADWQEDPDYMVSRRLMLIDELFTPDSSRFWDADYEHGRTPPSYDKQPLRDYLTSIGWDKTAPMPHLSEEVVAATAERYVRALRTLLDGSKIELPQNLPMLSAAS